MAVVVVERAFAVPLDEAGVARVLAAGAGCSELYEVTARFHLLARDGSRLACVFEAPDAEAVRNVTRAAAFSRPLHLWAATVHPGQGDDPVSLPAAADPRYGLAVVERSFAEPVAFDDVQAMEEAGHACFEMRDVTFIRSLFATGRQRMLCLYAAPDAETVREANRLAGLPFDRVWAARAVPHG